MDFWFGWSCIVDTITGTIVIGPAIMFVTIVAITMLYINRFKMET